MEKHKKMDVTELSDRDRKVLDRYTKFYTNFIESNTASSEIHEEERFPGRD